MNRTEDADSGGVIQFPCLSGMYDLTLWQANDFVKPGVEIGFVLFIRRCDVPGVFPLVLGGCFQVIFTRSESRASHLIHDESPVRIMSPSHKNIN